MWALPLVKRDSSYMNLNIHRSWGRARGGFLCLLKSERDLIPISSHNFPFTLNEYTCNIPSSFLGGMFMNYGMVKPLPILLGKMLGAT